MSSLNEKLASQMRSIRHERKMTLAEVATIALGSPERREQLSKFETEKTSVTIRTIERVFDALNCDLIVVPREKSKAVYDLLKK
mgnify:CR=1 FL=1